MAVSHGTQKKNPKLNILIPQAINMVTLENNNLEQEPGAQAQILYIALVGFAVSTQSCPGGLSTDPTDRSKQAHTLT